MKIDCLSDHLLIATPALQDTHFAKSVVYIYEHSELGAMGLIVNKALDITLGNVLEHLNIKIKLPAIYDLPVLLGGPVGQDHGFVIHDDTMPAKRKKSNDIIISASKDTLKSIAAGKGPKNFLVTLGYSGWEVGQLETEIMRNDWLVAPMEPDILFNTPIPDRWAKAAKLIGIDIHHLTEHSGNA